MRQGGQALLLALLMLVVAAFMLFALFSSGQVLSTRQRLSDAADAAALSAATWRARALNYVAYTNRAIVAQEVASAQAVTLASWAAYLDTLASNGETLAALHPPAAPLVSALASTASMAREATESTAALEIEWRADADFGYKVWLARSQEWLLRSADVFALGALANEVARASDRRFFAFAMSDGGRFARFIAPQDSPEGKARLREVVMASLDGFTGRSRNEDFRLPFPSSCVGRSANLDRWTLWLRRRGGTELHESLETWSAIDTASIHDWRPRGFLGLGGCSDREAASIGWGFAGDESGDGAKLLEARRVNPAAAARAQTDSGYRGTAAGLPRTHELSELQSDAPSVSRLAVLARVDLSDVTTADRAGIAAGRMNLRDASDVSRLSALSAAEVYFSPPPESGGVPQRPSLFSPFWQARLVSPSEGERVQAQAYVR